MEELSGVLVSWCFLIFVDGYVFFLVSGILGCGHYLKTSGKLLYFK